MTHLAPLLVLTALAPSGQEPDAYRPFVAPASDEAAAVLGRLQLAEGFRASLWAAEPRLANPVCLYVDHAGDVYVGETFRHSAGVTDIREHMDWLDDDLACRSVEDRVAMFAKHLGPRLADYEVERERVRLLRDTDGDGAADFDAVFADDFGEAADGIGAGLLSWGGDVWYTCIPSLWRLRDEDGDGRADAHERLSSGYGIRVALLGHDLHGLRIGPDGRLYFSCGDRGFDVVTREGERLEHWATGAVLRCELDGSHLEVFATGLRNPQELAFDEWGNLFTGDNNSDGGDRARVVDVLEGSDSGWRQAYQWITEPDLRGPWNAEKLWHPAHAGQAAYVLPPIENLADGPSGFTHYPGTGFGPTWAGHFFLVDFRGAAGYSGIHAFTLEPRGASFALGPARRFVWNVLATDADFGPDGALWISDWVEGWNKTGKGRIWRVESTDPAAREEAGAVRALLAEGMAARPLDELAGLLAHADQRVRHEAQLELVARGDEGVVVLLEAARAAQDLRARLHGLWGLGIVARRRDPALATDLVPLLEDDQDQVRANAARVLGDLRCEDALPALERALVDASPRVRLLAATALGRIGAPRSVEPLIELLRSNAEDDPALRHGAVFGLAGCADPGQLVALVADPSPRVRLGAVVALRRLGHLGIVPFLADADPLVAVEAARAVYDAPIEGALPALASRIDAGDLAGSALARRVLCANWRLGGEQRAEAVARFALREDQGELLRWEAVHLLGAWLEPPGRDPLTGEWSPIERDLVDRTNGPAYVARLVRELGEGGIGAAPARVVLAWLELVRRHGVEREADRLAAWAVERARPAAVRVECLRLLGEAPPADLVPTLRALLLDPEGRVRGAAVEALARVAPEEALPVVEAALERGGVEDLRAAYDTLARLATPAADAHLVEALERLAADLVPAEVALDLVQAAERRGDVPALRARLDVHKAPRGIDPQLAPWLDTLHGGDRERGRALFLESSELSCLRCHRVEEGPDGPLGGQVGPDLRGVSGRLSRLALLESIAAPNRRIAEGFRATLFLLDDDTLVEGLLLEEGGGVVRLRTSDDEVLELDAEHVVERRPGLSAMPDGLTQYLTPVQMRDLIAYLASL